MPRTKLNTKAIKAFRYSGDGQSRDVRWDASMPGFGLRIYPSGRKAFVLSYRFQGDKRMVVLGDFGTQLTLPQARERAVKERLAVGDGVDPIEAKLRARAATTFGQLADKFIEDYAKKYKKTWKTDEGRLKRHIPVGWGARKVKNITRDDIEALHTSIGLTRPYEANRTLDLLRVVFRQAKLWSSVNFEGDNPAEGIRKHEEHKRTRFLKTHELPALAKAIDAEPNVYHRAAMWLYLLTGVRKAELLGARWDDVDFNRGQLRLPKTKSGKEQEAALSAAAMAFLQGIPRQSGNPYILPGTLPGKHLVNIDKPWRRVRTAAGLSDLHLHDLRRTLGSWMTQAGTDLNVIKSALRHANISTTLIYSQLGEDPARSAIEAHGKQVLAAAGRSGPKEVADKN